MDMRIDRRAMVAGVAGWVATGGVARAQNLVVEEQFGDPALKPETLRFDRQGVADAVSGVAFSHKGTNEPRITGFGAQLLAEAGKYVGQNRTDNHGQIEAFLEMFGLAFEMDGKVVPFCAAGLSWVSATLYAKQAGKGTDNKSLRNYLMDLHHWHFYPSPSVLDMKTVAMGEHRWIPRSAATGAAAPKAGWLVVYNWNQDGKPDHVGIVDHLEGTQLHTVEFNTSAPNNSNGGRVARRIRAFNAQVEGFIRPDKTILA